MRIFWVAFLTFIVIVAIIAGVILIRARQIEKVYI